MKPIKSPLVLTSLACIGVLLACGPYFAPRILNYRSTVVTVPAANIALMFPENKKQSDAHRYYRNLPKRLQATLEADLADLKKAAPNLDQKIVDRYTIIRTDMILKGRMQDPQNLKPQVRWGDEKVLKTLPKEFSLYLQGAVAYRVGLRDEARKHWQELLNLPEAERKFRSVWAAWMLARSSTAKGEGLRWYKKVLALKKAGFPDSLAVTDKDWTAYFSYRSGDYTTALSLYIKQGKEDEIDSMEASRAIETVLDHLFHTHQADLTEVYTEMAAQKDYATAVSYYLRGRLSFLSHQTEEEKALAGQQLDLWIKALVKAKRVDKDQELGVTAVIAYDLQSKDSLRQCLDAMKKPTIDSLWLQAKQTTFAGELKKASMMYQKLTKMIKVEGATPQSTWLNLYGSYSEAGETEIERLFYLYSEYASVELARKNYGKALDLFLTVNNKVDAAYIAETIMSPIELLHHVRTSDIAQQSEWLKHLLSRKLMRNEYFKDAKAFILEKDLQKYNQYVTFYRTGINQSKSREERSRALEQAAYLQYDQGHILFRLENGARPFVRVHAAGRKMHKKYDYSKYIDESEARNWSPKMSKDELARVKKNYIRISPVRVKTLAAAELMYRAAMLLPRNDEHAAKLFWQAGDWTRADPEVADKYYKALIKRCWNTKLGKACDKRRWFVPSSLAE